MNYNIWEEGERPWPIEVAAAEAHASLVAVLEALKEVTRQSPKRKELVLEQLTGGHVSNLPPAKIGGGQEEGNATIWQMMNHPVSFVRL